MERDLANGEDQAGDGNPISLGGRVYDKGLGVHALSDVTIDLVALTGSCTTLRFDHGIDDRMRGGTAASVEMSVLGDGQELFTSGPQTGTSPIGSQEVDVTDVDSLVLHVDPRGAQRAGPRRLGQHLGPVLRTCPGGADARAEPGAIS